MVYEGLDAAGKVRYVGITGRDAAVRFGEHLNSIGTGKELLRYQVIKGAEGVADPRESKALMHTIEMWKNGKAYNLEVLFDKASNSIWHFKYSPIK